MSAERAARVAPARRIGLVTCSALVMGNMIGSGVYLLPASLAPFGGLSLLGWLFSGAGAVLVALVLASLGRAMPRTGGPYAFTREALGDFAGFFVGWGYWISLCAGNAAIAVAVASYASVFEPAIAARPALGALVAIGAVWLLVLVNARGVRAAGWVQVATTVIKIVPLVAVAAIGLPHIDWGNFAPFNPTGTSAVAAVTSCAALTLWAFLGLESATIPAEEVDRPERTIPLATVAGTLVTTLLYVASTIAVMGLVPRAALGASAAPFADAAAQLGGPWAARAVGAGAVVSAFGALNGWILVMGQIPMALARDELFPPVMGRRAPSGAPVAALAVSGAIVTVIVAANYTRGLVGMFTFVVLLATITSLLPYAFSAMAMIVLDGRAARSDAPPPPRRRGAGAIALGLLAFLYSLWAVAGAGRDAVYWGFIALLAGLPVYAFVRRRSRVADR
jgi:APA family basic amino acid/polyamine antiporter